MWRSKEIKICEGLDQRGRGAFRGREVSELPRSIQNRAEDGAGAPGEGVTRHPGAGAAQQLSVAGGKPLRNE